MSVPDPATEAMARAQQEYERAQLRLRNGMRYMAGGFEPDVGQSPKETVWRSGKAELWRYIVDEVSVRPPVLIVPSLVSKSYVVDLQPHNSFVGALGRAGLDIFLLDWGIPDEIDSENTFETYVDQLLPAAIDVVHARAGAEDVTARAGDISTGQRPALITLDGGDRVEADVVIGADGAASRVAESAGQVRDGGELPGLLAQSLSCQLDFVDQLLR